MFRLILITIMVSWLTYFAFRLRSLLWKPSPASPQVKIFGHYSQLLTWVKYRRYVSTEFQPSGWTDVWREVAVVAEWTIIILWGLWLGREFLSADAAKWLQGDDWQLNVQSYFGWGLLRQCGSCVLWNGSFNGGAPLFADLLAAMAHPLVVLLILAAGAINGSRYVAVCGIILAGLSQWYWGKVLRLGRVARIWSAVLASTAGFLIGRLEGGLVEMVFGIASFSLVLAAAVHLSETGDRKVAISLGLCTGLALLSGQGYLQVTFLLCILPSLTLLLFDRNLRLRPVWREFALAAGIAMLTSAVLWVPALHVLPHLTKPAEPDGYITVQPVEYQPLNLVIRSHAFYETDALQKLPAPNNRTANYIGWIPVLLAMLSLRLVPRARRRIMIFLWVAILMIYLLSSGLLIRWLLQIFPEKLMSWLLMARFVDLAASLAGPLLLALAAWGLDLLLKCSWPRMILTESSVNAARSFSLGWLLILPLVWSVRDTHHFVQPWLEVVPEPAEANYDAIIARMKLETVQWVEVPYQEWGFQIAALEHGLKLTNAYHLWSWKDRTPPLPFVAATRDSVDPDDANFRESLENASLLDYPENHFAYIEAADRKIPCRATARGGNIDVDCRTDVPGELVVTENAWDGWKLKRDGRTAALIADPWLKTNAPAGNHHYAFRYRPWDVPLGMLLSLSGLGLALWFGSRPKLHHPRAESARAPL